MPLLIHHRSHLLPSFSFYITAHIPHPHFLILSPFSFFPPSSLSSTALPTLILSTLKSPILFALANGPSSLSTNAFFRSNSSRPGVLKTLCLLAVLRTEEMRLLG